MSDRTFRTLRSTCRLTITLLCIGIARGVAADAPPNVLFLFSDDQQWNAIGAMGNDHIITPNLDRLVEEGFTFRQTYCMGSNSGAVCGPSRAMLLTGRTMHRALVDGKYGDLPDVPLWPEVFRNAGYRTFGTGKWHNGKPTFVRSFTDGGAIFFGGMHGYNTGGHYRPRVYDFDSSGVYEGQPRVADKFSSELYADAAIEFLLLRARKNTDEQPFFAYVSFTAPHDPRHAPQEYVDLYDDVAIPIPPNFAPKHPFDNGEMRIRDEVLAPFPRTPEVVREHLRQYYAMITHMDAQIGRILDTLDETGERENTIIIFAGDHGLAVGQHGLLGKQNLYEHSMRAPLTISGPGIPAGQTSDALAYLFDIYPTACELAGLSAPSTVDGESLAPIMRGDRESVRDFVFLLYKNKQHAVRDERYKLIRYTVGDEITMQLFDLTTDPYETSNRIDDPALGPVRSRLEALMRDQFEQNERD